MEITKKIDINGTANKYAIKKLINDHGKHKEMKKRVVTQNWNFDNKWYEYSYQIQILKSINNNSNNINDEISKIMAQEINKKINNYKQQDLLKNRYDKEKFITFENVIKKIAATELKCRYCDCELAILYDISREMKQWSIDRIDNDQGHNNDNFHLACLDCNLKRRRRTDEKFLFTKKLNLIKQEQKIEELKEEDEEEEEVHN